ncbi:MAG: hypothetical protein JXA77_11400 [Bacteroidales bacterium]|nr:hypothetical protein [Bacteroidales bacterium]MBN2817442.1 hypothetical protein [Bacteroidales bacterium]
MRKRFHFFRISVTLVICLFSFTFLFAQEKIGREIHESFNLSNSSKLHIKNKYGNIDFRNWNKQVADVKVQIVFRGIDDEKIEEIVKSIEIKQYTSGSDIYFETSFDDEFNKEFMRLNNGEKGFEVNYIIQMPHNLAIDVENKYGNVFIDKLSSPSVIAVKYGKLKVNDITSENKEPLTQIHLGYSEGTVEVSGWLKVDMKYSKLNIVESKALVIMSKYSKIYVDRGSSIVTESKYDEYKIGTIANFVTEAAYSNFSFESIGKKLHTETSYSDFKVGYIPPSFEVINVYNRYGSYRLGVEDGASYKLKGLAKYGNISYPDNGRVNRFQETTELKVEGVVGKSDAKAEVVIDTKYGNVKLND